MHLRYMHFYANDSTVHGQYIEKPTVSRTNIAIGRRRVSVICIVAETLHHVSLWSGRHQRYQNTDMLPSLQVSPLESRKNLRIQGVTLQSDFNHRDDIKKLIRTAARKLRLLKKVHRFFTAEYDVDVSCIRIMYRSHVWDGSAQFVSSMS